MASGSKNAQQDRLSEMPDKVLINILTLCHCYKAAVRCSALSKRWSGLHARLPCLYLFENDLIRASEFSKRYKTNETFDMRPIWLRERLGAVLFSHTAAVETFYLQASRGPHWDHCLRFLSRNNIRCIHLNSSIDGTEVPNNLFSFQRLESLCLQGFCLPKSPPIFAGFTNLCTLELHGLRLLEMPLLDKFLSLCHALKHLKVKALWYYGKDDEAASFTVSSSTLSTLAFEIRHEDEAFHSLRLTINTPNLAELRLDVDKLGRQWLLYSNDSTKLPIVHYGLVAGRWSTGLLTHVEIDARRARLGVHNNGQFLTDITAFSFLKGLKVSNVQAHPEDFWHMLAQLPLLLTVSLHNCHFQLGHGIEKLHPPMEIFIKSFIGTILSSPWEAAKTMMTLLFEKAHMLETVHLVFELLDETDSCRSFRYFMLLEQLMSARFGTAETSFQCREPHLHPKGFRSLLYKKGQTRKLLQVREHGDYAYIHISFQ